MTFIPVIDCAEVSLKFSQTDGEFAENTFGVQRDEAWDHASLLAVANAFVTWWDVGDGAGGIYRTFQAAGVNILGATARDLTTEGGMAVDSTVVPAHTHGTAANFQLQNGVSFAVTARTGLAGRSQRGRTFLVGLANDVLTASGDDVINAGVAANFILMMNKLILNVTAADAHSKLVVISRRHNNAPRVTGVTTAITNYGIHDNFLDYQRRRAPGHNRHH